MKSGKKILSLLLTLAFLVLAVCMLFSCKKTVTVRFESDGGTNVASVTVNPGDAIGAPENPTREGYSFAGWKTEGGELYNFASPVTSDMLLIASWVKDDSQNKATVSFDLKGGDKTNYTTSVEVQKGSVLSEPAAPQKTGYEFLGWFYLGEKYDFTNRIVSGDITLVAHWKLLSYSISYDLQGGKIDGALAEYTAETGAVIPNPTKLGYEFLGWTYEGVTSPVASLSFPVGASGNIALTANWRAVEYTISYEGVDGASVPDDIIKSYSIESDSFTLPAVSKENYDFLGWQTFGEGTPVLELSVKKGSYGDLVFTAVFAPTEYEIVYNLGEGGVNNPDNPLYTTVESLECTLKAPTRPGYKFVGWSADGATKLDVKVPAGNTKILTYTAVWEKESYTISFNAFNGKFHDGESIPESFTVDTLPIKLPNIYLNDKCFVSWFTDEDFANPITEITECENIKLFAKFVDASAGLVFGFNGTGYDVVGYTGEDSVVYVPEFYKQYPVTSIAASAFEGSTVDTVYLPESIAAIGEKAFLSSSVKNVYIPENAKLKTIAKFAFAGTAIESFKAPAALEFIGEGAFLGSAALSSINLEATSLTVISASAFEGTSLKSVVIPASVVSVGEKAFFSCASLVSISFADGSAITEISAESFKNCISLESIAIPASVISINESAFENCASLASVAFDSASELVLVGKSAFRNCDSLTAVSFPAKLSRVGEYAFYSNDALTSVGFVKDGSLGEIGKNAFAFSAIVSLELPDNLTAIREGAFASSKALTAVSFNENLYVIEKSAFESCVSLVTVSLDFNTDAKNGAFTGCSGVENLTVNKFNPKDIFGGSLPAGIKNVVLLNEGEIAEGSFAGLNYLESLTLPFVGLTQPEFGGADAVKTFSDLFGGAAPMSLKTVTITGGTYVPENAFANCEYIQTIILPASTKTIGKSAFRGCAALSYLELPMAMTGDDSADFAEDVCTKTFAYIFGETIPVSLRTVKISAYGDDTNARLPEAIFVGSSVRNVTLVGFDGISNSAFEGVKTLVSVDISESLIKEIGDNAFKGCLKLESFTVPASVGYIGYYAFAESGLLGISFENGSEISDIRDGAFRDCKALATISLPETVSVISAELFAGCEALSAFTLSDNVATISASAFEGCASLKAISFGKASKLASIGESAFKASGLESFTLPISVSSIPAGAFENCVSLKEFNFTLPGRLDTVPVNFVIGEGAFKNTGLVTVSVPDYVTAIMKSAFEGAESLVSVSFSDDSLLSLIDARAFAECKSLVSFVIPKDVASVADECFKNCSVLKSVSFADGNAAVSIGNGAFENCLFLESIALPASITLVSDYAFANCFALREIALPTALLTIGSNSFKNCDALTSVTLPATLESLGEYAFYNCDTLAELKFADGSVITEISANAFLNCAALKSLTVPASVVSIGEYAFRGCQKLEAVSFAEGSLLAEISDGAFFGCASLKSLKAPESLVSIGEEAFSGCASLIDLEITTNVIAIGNFAFSECPNLVITVTYFAEGGDEAWLECKGLDEYWNTDNNEVKFVLSRTYTVIFG